MEKKKLRNTLKIQRAKRDLTQAELAELVGVTTKTINTVENCVYVPSTYLSLKLAKVLGVTVEELFQLDEENV
jgi:putative transcriptional regulator